MANFYRDVYYFTTANVDVIYHGDRRDAIAWCGKDGKVYYDVYNFMTAVFDVVPLLDAGSHVKCPWNINRLKKHDFCYDDL